MCKSWKDHPWKQIISCSQHSNAVWLLRSQKTYMKKCDKKISDQLLWSILDILIYFDDIFNLKVHTKKLNRFVKLHKRPCLFLHQSTYSTFPSFMNSHFTFAPSLAEEIFFERALNSISKSNLKTNIRQDLYDNNKKK